MEKFEGNIAGLEILYLMKFGEEPRKIRQASENRQKMLELCIKNDKKIEDLSIEELKKIGMEGIF